MSEIALDCGYPASSLKERVYALSGASVGGADRFGILIYTATAGAQGTLGRLVGTVPRFAHILRSALDRAAICSWMTAAATAPLTALHATAACSSPRRAARCATCFSTAICSCRLWRKLRPASLSFLLESIY